MTAAREPTVSVIVPVRNRPELLDLLLRSLATQTFREFEVVLVDDGSSTSLDQPISKARECGLDITYLRTEGVGAVEARCVGVSKAQGRILAFTDSDCEADPRWLEEGVRAISAGADLVQGVTKPVRPAGFHERTLAYRGGEGLFATCNVFYRRDAFDAAGGFDRSTAGRFRFRPGPRARGLGFGEDTLLGWRVARNGEVRVAEEAVVRHAVTRESLRELFSRAWQIGAFPALVREVPELRRTLLRSGIFIGSDARIPIYLAAVAALLGRHRFATIIAAVWVGRTWIALGKRGLRWKGRLAALPFELGQEAVKAFALVLGSARTRTPVL